MITTNLYDDEGKVAGKVNLPEKFFGAKVNEKLVTQAVRVYLAHQRRAQPKTKTRGEVNLTKAKWFRQKGTGRARHGSQSAPLFVGGGVAHGPRGNQNWDLKLPEKMRKQALASALTSKFQAGQVVVLESLEKVSGKTKELAGLLKSFIIQEGKKTKKETKFLLIIPEKMENVQRAGQNVPNLLVRQMSQVNAYEVLRANKILLSSKVVEVLK